MLAFFGRVIDFIKEVWGDIVGRTISLVSFIFLIVAVVASVVVGLFVPGLQEAFRDLGLLTPLSGIYWLPVIVVPIVGIILCSKWLGVKDPLNIIDGIETKEERGFFKSAFVIYFAWGWFQQLVCVLVFAALVNFVQLDYRVAALITCFIFGAFHIPNFTLLFSTMIMSRLYMDHFQEYHNLWMIGFAHGVLGTVLERYLPRHALSTAFTIWGMFSKTQKEVEEKLKV